MVLKKMIQMTGSEFIFQRLNSNKLFFVSWKLWSGKTRFLSNNKIHQVNKYNRHFSSEGKPCLKITETKYS